MADDRKWRHLCESILSEKNPERLWQLVEELNRTLAERETQLRRPNLSLSRGPGGISMVSDESI